MKTLAIAAVIASLSAPAFAGSNDIAVAHFNQDFDSSGDVVRMISADDTTAVSTRQGLLADVFAQFNADYDSTGDVVGENGATLISGEAAYAADKFAAIKAESAEDE